MEVCSYCQREYGTISINNKHIFMTFDHIFPRDLVEKRKNRSGIVSKGDKITIEELNNLITCCNECNILKARKIPKHFYNLMCEIESHKTSKDKVRGASYLNYTLIRNIKNSLRILILTKPEPLPLNYLENE